VQQVELLGKAMLYDKQLSVNRNEACAFCHMPETGFTGPVSELNLTTGSYYPGSVRTRFSNRKPQTHAYAPLSPVLHYNPGQGEFLGHACHRPPLGQPSGRAGRGEMGLPDIACAVYRASQRPYRALFERKWGAQAFAIEWPADVEQVCNQRGPPPANDPMPVHLTELDRGRAAATFDQMAQSIAGYEASAEVTPLTSKFDAVLAGKVQFTVEEQEGYALFRGKAQCNNCHRDGGPGEDPLFTDFTASNIGTPANLMLPYYAEQQPDARGYAPTRPDQDMSIPVSAVFSPSVTCSATLPQLMHDGARWHLRTWADFRYQLCEMWISNPIQTSSKPMDTMAISRALRRSSISTTRATSCGAAAPMTPARAARAGLRQSPPKT
jgi:cytochrome c peroxidase